MARSRTDDGHDPAPLNAIRVFNAIAKEATVTRAAALLGITQSSASRHLAVLERHLGTKLLERRGRNTELTQFGRLFAEAIREPIEAIEFAVQRMRRSQSDNRRLVVRTSVPTFAYSTLIPNIQDFSDEIGGAVVDVVTSLSAPSAADDFDVLVTRDIEPSEAADQWKLLDEHLVCVGATTRVSGHGLAAIDTMPVMSVTSRPDILPRWMNALGIPTDEITLGARFDHHYLALPAVTTGQGLLVAPEIVISDLVDQGILKVLPGSRVPSGMSYSAYALDRSGQPDLARAFCRWLFRLCRRSST